MIAKITFALDWLKKKEKKAVISLIIGFMLLISAACFWKYAIFGYNGIDLAYFSQLFWNTVRGRLFVQSIHPHLSLGDHAEFAILWLSPVYAVGRDPRMLLAMQAAALAACAWPIWRIARFRFSARVSAAFPLAALAMTMAFLLNPALQNVGLFEFHVLAFAALPLLMAMLAYEMGDKKAFAVWCLLALSVREDVALVVAMIGVLAWIEKKPRWWRLTPLMLGAAWFLAAMQVVRHFAPEGSYKYLVYYRWLGSTPLEMLKTMVLHPIRVLGHVLTLANFEMVLGFLFPFALFPVLKPKRLLLAAGPLLQIILGAPGGGEVVLDTHYATLFIPALALAAIDGAEVAPYYFRKYVRFLSHLNPVKASFLLLGICSAYGAMTLGPLPSVAFRALSDRLSYARAQRDWALLERVPSDANIAASYALLPALSSREHLTSLHYLALGVTQFGEKSYEPPDGLRMVAMDADDLITYRAQFPKTAWAAPHYDGWRKRIEAVLGTPVFSDGTLTLYDRSTASAPISLAPPPTRANGKPGPPHADAISGGYGKKVRISIDLSGTSIPENGTMRYRLTDALGRTVADDAILVDSPMPWALRNGGVSAQYSATVPKWATWPIRAQATLEATDSALVLDDVRTAVRFSGQNVVLATFDLPQLAQPK